MRTDFFVGKSWFTIVLSQLLAGFIGVCMCYAVMINYAAATWIGKSFYFLVSENTHLEVSIHETRLDGGAGYLFDFGGEEYVAWSVYFKEEDGIAVQAGISERTRLLKVDISHLYFKTRLDKLRRNEIEGALNSFYGCIDVLAQGLAKLDQGLTQEACKRVLSLLNKEYAYMGEIYRESYPQFSEVCASMHSALTELLTKTIYGKDLRYLLCGACDAYIRLATAFTL